MSPITLLAVCVLATSDWPTIRTDPEGVGLPPGVVARIGSTRFRHNNVCNDLHFSRDNKQLISLQNSGEFAIWNLPNGQPRKVQGKLNAILQSALRDDNSCVVLHEGSNRTLSTIDLATGAVRKEFTVSKDSNCFQLSTDGNAYACVVNAQVLVFDTQTMKLIHETRLSISDTSPTQIALSADLKLVAASFQQWTEVKELATGKSVYSGAVNRDDEAMFVRFSPNGQQLLRLVSAKDYRVEAIDLATGKCQTVYESEKYFSILVYSADGKACFLTANKRLIRVDLQTKKATDFGNIGLQKMNAEIAVSCDGKIIAIAGRTHTITFWDAETGKRLPYSADELQVTNMTVEFVGEGRRIAISDPTGGGTAATGGTSGQLYDVATQKLVRNIEPHDTDNIRFLPNGEEYVQTSPLGLEVRDVLTDRPSFRADLKQARTPVIRLCANSPYVFADGLENVHYWDLKTKKKYEPFSSVGLDFIPSPDGQWAMKMIMNSGRRTRDGWLCVLVNLNTRLEHPDWQKSFAANRELLFNPIWGFVVLYGNTEQDLKCVELTTGRVIWEFQHNRYMGLGGSAFSRDGRNLACVSQGYDIEIREASTGKLRLRLPLGEIPQGVAFHPNGRLLAILSPTAPLHLYDFRGEYLRYPKSLSPRSLELLWKELTGPDTPAAFEALRRMAAAPDSTIPFLRKQVQFSPPPTKEEVEAALKSLDAPSYRDREEAQKKLQSLADRIEGQLRATEQTTQSLEVRTRLEKLRNVTSLEKPESVRRSRILEVVEWCGTPEAKKLLESWGAGPPEDNWTIESRKSLDRMNSTKP
jgi:WD40 repeat protein